MSEHARDLRTVATWLDANDAPVHAAKMREIAAALEAEGKVVGTALIERIDIGGATGPWELTLIGEEGADLLSQALVGQRVQVRVVGDGEGEP